ncbi:hypothetical protein KAR52_03345 [Candidatus Pacearchaeota archaeon]|nr:hypothetical protein [Candidatus Pacearchaeota archaeon]
MDFFPIQPSMFTPKPESQKYDFSNLNSSMFLSPQNFNGSPSLDSKISPKYDLNKIDFSSLIPQSFRGSPSLESNILNKPIKDYSYKSILPKMDYSILTPLGFRGSPSLESTIAPEYNPVKIDYLNEDKHKGWGGQSWSKSFEPDGLYMKNLSKNTQLHVHTNENGLMTWAKIKEMGTEKTLKRLTNFEACIEDLKPGKSFWAKNKDRGIFKW